MRGLVVPADVFLELARVYKRANQEEQTRSIWIQVQRLEWVAQSKLDRSRKEDK